MAEQLEVFTREGNPTGIIKSRGDIHRDGDWHIATFAWLIDSHTHEVLLQKRAMNKDVWPGRWDASAAGHLEAGESIASGMQRELEEELGLPRSFTANRLERLEPFHFEEHTHANGIIDREIHAIHLLRLAPHERALLTPGEEVIMIAWASADDLLRHTLDRSTPLRTRARARARAQNEKDLLLSEGDLVPYATSYLTTLARHALA